MLLAVAPDLSIRDDTRYRRYDLMFYTTRSARVSAAIPRMNRAHGTQEGPKDVSRAMPYWRNTCSGFSEDMPEEIRRDEVVSALETYHRREVSSQMRCSAFVHVL